jgi:hypothetical protein
MIAASFTVTPAPTGYTYSTAFSCTNTSTLTGAQIKQYVWNFGDGSNLYETNSPVHTYKYPGNYTINLTAYDNTGDSDMYSVAVSVSSFYLDEIAITSPITSSWLPGVTAGPLTISITSTNIDQPLDVQLYALNSNSTPFQSVPSKWSFLAPTWYFTDVNNNLITSLSISAIPIFNEYSIQNGVTGTGTFYYVDSLSANNITITATLQTSSFADPVGADINYYPSYSNSNVSASTVLQIQNTIPNNIRITGNYIDNITSYKWVNVPISIMLTLHNVTDNVSSGIIFDYPPTNEVGNTDGLTLSAYDENNNPIPCIFDTTQRFQNTRNNNPAGGYLFTTVTPLATGTGVYFIASTLTASGTSTTFNIFDFYNTFNTQKINQNFNMAGYMQSLALPDILPQNTNLFGPFLNAVAGNSQTSTSIDLGQTVYEKIANFTSNNGDIDTCGVKQLLSMADMVDVDSNVYSSFYPADIQSTLDLTSITPNKLYGNPDLQFIEPDTTNLTRRYPLDTTTAFVTAGTTIALQSIYQSDLQYVTVPLGTNNTTVYPLSSFNYPGLIPPILQHYKFYSFMPIYPGSYSTFVSNTTGEMLTAFNDLTYDQADLLRNTFITETWYNPFLYDITVKHTGPNFINNIIDWGNPNTTLSPYLSTAEDLYKDGGIIEAMFNFYLTKNLFYNVE